MNDFEELEKMVIDEAPEPAPDRSPLTRAKFAYHTAVILIDIVTAYTVGLLTFWYYGVIWFLGNAVVFFLHHSNWERAESNEKQTKNAIIGMVVAVASMFILATFSGAMVLTVNRPAWISIAIEVFAVTVFFFHAGAFAFYYFQDDEWTINRQISKAKANANKKVKIAQAAGTIVDASKRALRERENQYGKHGRNVVDLAMGKVENRPVERLQKPAQASFASQTPDYTPEAEKPAINPRTGQERKD
jgi:hypothetical protein